MVDWKTARENLPNIPAGEVQGPPLKEVENFMQCRACAGWFDMRDLSEAFRHEEADHEAEAAQ